jgi:hypothetical protein
MPGTRIDRDPYSHVKESVYKAASIAIPTALLRLLISAVYGYPHPAFISLNAGF